MQRFSSVLQNSPQGLQGTGLIFFFFFKLLGKVSNSNAVLSLSLALLLQRQLEASFQVHSPAEHSIPGEAAEEDSLRALIPAAISGSISVCGNL